MVNDVEVIGDNKLIFERGLNIASFFKFHIVKLIYWKNNPAIYIKWNLNTFICYLDYNINGEKVFKIVQELKIKHNKYHYVNAEFLLKNSDVFYKLFSYIKKFRLKI